MNVASGSRSLEQAAAWLAGFLLVGLSIFLCCPQRFQLFPVGTRVDLGDVSIGQTTEKSFTISNPSTTAIVILGWAPTCHCVAARFPQGSLPPGGSINAYVQTSATTPLGKRAAIIFIRWHFVGDNDVQTDNLVVSARYVSPLLFSEDRLDFSNVGYGEVQRKDLLVQPGNTAGKWNGLEVSPTSDRLSARVVATPSGFRIDTHFNPTGLPSGAWKGVIRIFPLQDGKRTGQETDLPVVAKIEGPFAPSPPVLQFFERRTHGLSFLLKVHSSTVVIRRLRLLGNIVQDPQVKISSDGKDATVSGSLSQPARGQMFVGKIPLQINDGPEGALDVSFIGFAG
jgi:hypothetical protein